MSESYKLQFAKSMLEQEKFTDLLHMYADEPMPSELHDRIITVAKSQLQSKRAATTKTMCQLLLQMNTPESIAVMTTRYRARAFSQAYRQANFTDITDDKFREMWLNQLESRFRDREQPLCLPSDHQRLLATGLWDDERFIPLFEHLLVKHGYHGFNRLQTGRRHIAITALQALSRMTHDRARYLVQKWLGYWHKQLDTLLQTKSIFRVPDYENVADFLYCQPPIMQQVIDNLPTFRPVETHRRRKLIQWLMSVHAKADSPTDLPEKLVQMASTATDASLRDDIIRALPETNVPNAIELIVERALQRPLDEVGYMCLRQLTKIQHIPKSLAEQLMDELRPITAVEVNRLHYPMLVTYMSLLCHSDDHDISQYVLGCLDAHSLAFNSREWFTILYTLAQHDDRAFDRLVACLTESRFGRNQLAIQYLAQMGARGVPILMSFARGSHRLHDVLLEYMNGAVHAPMIPVLLELYHTKAIFGFSHYRLIDALIAIGTEDAYEAVIQINATRQQ